jgi:hypothetical protein
MHNRPNVVMVFSLLLLDVCFGGWARSEVQKKKCTRRFNSVANQAEQADAATFLFSSVFDFCISFNFLLL